jgi:hypothetical protein
MLLTSSDGLSFATGATAYDYHSVSGSDTSDRIILKVQIEGQSTEAVVDTGAPFVVCSPDLARLIGFDSSSALYPHKILIRGSWVQGSIHRVSLTIPASEGNSISLEVTAFVPDPDEEMLKGNFPSFISLFGCLERLRFAVDPSDTMFYFGPLP